MTAMRIAVVLVLAGLSLAAIGARSLQELLAKAAEAGKAHNVDGWMALYCKPGAPVEADKTTIAHFTRAYLAEPRLLRYEGSVKELMMCSETLRTKEKCLIVPIIEGSAGFCLAKDK
jgi:hypothetical protein